MEAKLLARGLLGNARQALAAGEFGPDGARLDADRSPQRQEVIKHVGALAHQLGLVAADALDQRLDGFLAQLLGDLLAAAAEQAGGIGGVGIGALAAFDHDIEPVEHMLAGTARFLAPFQRFLFGFLLLGHAPGKLEGGTLGRLLEGALGVILPQNHAAREICRTGTPARARCSFAWAMVKVPKWKIDAASTADAPPLVTPSTR